MSPERRPSSTIWMPTHRAIVLLLLSGLAIFSAMRVILHPTHLPQDLPPSGPRAHELADRVDPNVASWEELAALPNIGEKRARDIVEYREAQRARFPQRPVFRTPQDLQNVRGVGPAITNQLMPYLVFPRGSAGATAPATEPASQESPRSQ